VKANTGVRTNKHRAGSWDAGNWWKKEKMEGRLKLTIRLLHMRRKIWKNRREKIGESREGPSKSVTRPSKRKGPERKAIRYAEARSRLGGRNYPRKAFPKRGLQRWESQRANLEATHNRGEGVSWNSGKEKKQNATTCSSSKRYKRRVKSTRNDNVLKKVPPEKKKTKR